MKIGTAVYACVPLVAYTHKAPYNVHHQVNICDLGTVVTYHESSLTGEKGPCVSIMWAAGGSCIVQIYKVALTPEEAALIALAG